MKYNEIPSNFNEIQCKYCEIQRNLLKSSLLGHSRSRPEGLQRRDLPTDNVEEEEGEDDWGGGSMFSLSLQYWGGGGEVDQHSRPTYNIWEEEE